MANDQLRVDLQAVLGNAYALERELGGGGMSRVFVATETALHRRVVIKVLSPELAQGLSAERFAREIELAANLQDPHIVPVLNTGTANGLPWFTMPYVEGESLRARLMRGALPYNEAVGILRDVALALEYAHTRGVVHRDIKPENVLLAGRTAVVADFGIAKALSAARTEGGGASATLTSAGQSLGTPAYMAPEQAVGDPADHRADLYAWGVMAYELLAEKHPFANKATTQQLIAAQITERPAPLGTVKPGIAPPLAAFVMQCLEKAPGDRPASAGAIIEALDGMVTPGASGLQQKQSAARRPLMMAAGVLLVAVLAIGGKMLASRNGASGAADVPIAPRIAVLPFENLGDSTDALFVGGMTDAVRSKLTGLSELVVIARASSTPYAHTTKTPKEIGEELGVRYLLTGTVRFAKSADGTARVQVSPALIEVGADGAAANKWEQPFDADAADVFKVQGEIAGKVASAMQLALGASSRTQLASALTSNPAAYEAYLRGDAAWDGGSRTDGVATGQAVEFFEQAVTLDPNMAEAWAALARAQLFRFVNTLRADTALETKALDAVNRAMALDPASTSGQLAMAMYNRAIAVDPATAVGLLERARRSAPNDARLPMELGSALSDLGRFDEADRAYELASRLDPRATRIWVLRARIALRRRDQTAGLQASQRAIALAPTNLQAIQVQVMNRLASGDLVATQALVTAASSRVPIERLVAYLGTFQDLGWILTPDQERILLALTPGAFDARAEWAYVIAQQYSWRGDSAEMRTWGARAAESFDQRRRAAPNDPQLHVLYGLSLAMAGKPAEAMRAVRTGLATKSSYEFNNALVYCYYVAARTAVLAGDRVQAISWLAEALRRGYYASPAWIRLEPSFKPLHGDPKFEQILAAK